MKRNLTYIILICLILAVPFMTNCTIYDSEGGTCRGLCYECGDVFGPNDGCGAMFLDCLDPGQGDYDDFKDSVAIVAVADVDYANPTVSVYYEDGWKYTFSLDILTSYETPWKISAEFCFLQNGIKVGEVKIDESEVKSEKYEINNKVSMNKFFDSNGGEVTVIINSLSMARMPK